MKILMERPGKIFDMTRFSYRNAFWCALVLIGVLSGCAEPVEQVNFVQPHYVSKADFVGDWHYKQTIVDMSPESSLGFAGLEGEMEKVPGK